MSRGVRPQTLGPPAVMGVALVLLTVQAPLTVAQHGISVGPALALAVAHTAAAPLAVRRPALGAVLSVAASTAQMVAVMRSDGGIWPWGVTPMITQLLVLAVLAILASWRVLIGALVGSVATSAVLVLVGLPWRPWGPAISNVLLFASLAALAAGLALALEQLNRTRDALRREREIGAEEQARRLVVEEKSRIARELHDIIAHNMSLVTVQARSAPHRLVGLGPEAAAEFDDLATRAADALAQMRGVLTVLRTEPGQSGLSPVPGFEEILALVDAVRDAGQQVELAWDVPPDVRVGEDVGAAAHRIVQEAVSNVLRHAPGRPAVVRVTVEQDEVVMTVHNAADRRSPDGAPVDGHGVVGMRERATMLGGTLVAGFSRPDRFTVEARLPIAPVVDVGTGT